MTNCEKIISAMQRNKNSFCDDCLVKITGISPRQQINQICNKKTDIFSKIYGKPCAICGKIKITRGLHGLQENQKGEAMTFYVYENWRAADKTVIHRADCGYCNNGMGSHENPNGNANGIWHGPFSTFQQAQQKADSLSRRENLCCGNCRPENYRM